MTNQIVELEEMLKDRNQRVSELQERLVILRAATKRTLMLMHRIERSYPRARFFKRGEAKELQFCCVS